MNKNFLVLFAMVALVSFMNVNSSYAIGWGSGASKKVQDFSEGLKNKSSDTNETVTNKVEAVENKMNAMLGQPEKQIENSVSVAEDVIVTPEVKDVNMVDQTLEEKIESTKDVVENVDGVDLIEQTEAVVIEEAPVTQTSEEAGVVVLENVENVKALETSEEGKVTESTEEEVAKESKMMVDEVFEVTTNAVDSSVEKAKNIFKEM